MKYQLKTTAKFRKDLKLMKKRGMNVKLLTDVVDMLLDGQQLPEKYRDHGLSGKYKGFRECHIQPDWLLIYLVNETELILTTARTGSHADLLGM